MCRHDALQVSTNFNRACPDNRYGDYYWHRFDDPAVIDAAGIIGRQPGPARIRSLFPASTVDRAESEFGSYKRRSLILPVSWLLLSAGSITFFVVRKMRLKRTRAR